MNSTNREMARFEAALEERPIVVLWRYCPYRKVQVAWHVDDPYVDGSHNGAKTHCKHGHEFTDDNTIITSDGRQCRTCKNEKRKSATPEQKRRAAALKRMRRAEREPDIQVEYVECTDPDLLAATELRRQKARVE